MNSVFDLAVIGAGPGGLAAAVTAAELGLRVALLDENSRPGGQIWRADRGAAPPSAREWIERLHRSETELFESTTVWGSEREGVLSTSSGEIQARKIVLACGARELFLPFPGWTLRNAFGAGALQAFMHSGLDLMGKRVVVAGSGPLLLQVAAQVRKHGGKVLRIAEQAPLSRLIAFSRHLDADKLWQAIALANPRFRTSSWPIEALGESHLEGVRLQIGGRREELACDYLAVGFGLVPNLELPRALGCGIRDGHVAVDQSQRTSQDTVYAVGELCGVKGAPGALADAVVAACDAAEQEVPDRWIRRRDRQLRFSRALAEAFELRQEVLALADESTVICRCEQVPVSAVRRHDDWTSAKRHSRCGMGFCQGRVCGSATQALFGWGPSGSRPPLTPISIGEWLADETERP